MDIRSTLLATPLVSWFGVFAISFGLVFLFLNIIDAVLFDFTGRDLVAKAATAAMGVLVVDALGAKTDGWFALRALPVVFIASAAYFRQVKQLAMRAAVRTDGRVAHYQDGTVEKLPVPSHLFVVACVLLFIFGLRVIPVAFLERLRTLTTVTWLLWAMVGLSVLLLPWAAWCLTRSLSEVRRDDAVRAVGR